MDEKHKERFIRWQSRLIEQSAYLNNLLTTIGIATIGFMFSLVSKEFNPSCCQKLLITSGLFIVFLSTLFGILGAITRLFDYRATLKKIRLEIKKDSGETIGEFRKLYKVYGSYTWCFFHSQSITLLLGIFLLAVGLISYYSNKFL